LYIADKLVDMLSKITWVVVISCFIPFIGRSQSIIAVQNATGASFYQTLNDAITNAVSGDKIYIPGGNWNLTVPIDKELHIYGVGHDPDSTLATGITSITANLNLTTGADGGSLNGLKCDYIYFGTSTSNNDVNGYAITRVNAYYIEMRDNSPSNIIIKEAVVREHIYIRDAQNILILNSYIGSVIFQANGNVLIDHCMVMSSGSSTTLSDITNAVVSNSFIKGNVSGSTGTIFNNNIFGSTFSLVPGYGSGNFTFINFNSGIFMNFTGGSAWSYDFDLRLAPGSIGVGAATDGTDIGLFGGSEPFKEGSLPIIPHIEFKSIATHTNADGLLDVNIRVRAQTR